MRNLDIRWPSPILELADKSSEWITELDAKSFPEWNWRAPNHRLTDLFHQTETAAMEGGAPSNAISENFWKCQIAPRGDRQWQLRWWFRLGRSLIFHRKQLKAEIIRKTIRTGIAVWWWSQSNRQIGVKKDKQQNAWPIFVNDLYGLPLPPRISQSHFDSFLKM